MKKWKNIKPLVVLDDFIIVAKGYRLFKWYPISEKLVFDGVLEDTFYAFLSKFYLTRRLFRAEVINLYSLSDESQVCIAKKGLFKKEKNSKIFKKCFSVPRGSRPMNICVLEDDSMFFGEYFANIDKQCVNVYGSKDKGKTWDIVYTFDEGNINHIHGLYFDKYTESIWVVTGDRENECIIGFTSDRFKTFNIVFRGGQEYRSCVLFFYEKFIVFATDSQYIKNSIKTFDRESMEVCDLKNVQGPVIKGGQVGNISFLTTDIEPSKINLTKKAHLWITKNGKDWNEVYEDEKDLMNPTLFQFGSFVFPRYDISSELTELYFSGKALKNSDNNTLKIRI